MPEDELALMEPDVVLLGDAVTGIVVEACEPDRLIAQARAVAQLDAPVVVVFAALLGLALIDVLAMMVVVLLTQLLDDTMLDVEAGPEETLDRLPVAATVLAKEVASVELLVTEALPATVVAGYAVVFRVTVVATVRLDIVLVLAAEASAVVEFLVAFCGVSQILSKPAAPQYSVLDPEHFQLQSPLNRSTPPPLEVSMMFEQKH